MATYVVINLIFLAIIGAVAARRAGWRRRTGAAVLILLCLMTVAFDSWLVATDIVAYDLSAILGLRLGAAPIEDFAYTIAVFWLVPALWRWQPRRSKENKS